jgi:ACR3 family arsenite transporter
MAVGTGVGQAWPELSEALEGAAVGGINLIVAVLLWVIMVPMAARVELSALLQVPKNPRALIVTTVVNWLVQPFAMYGLAVLFFRHIYSFSDEVADAALAGAVLLGGSPCTALVFAWSELADGDPAYTLFQVALNDVLILILYAPTAKLLLAIDDIPLPFTTLLASVLLFVVVPFAIGFVLRRAVFGGDRERLATFQRRCSPWSQAALLLMLVLIFLFQGSALVATPLRVLAFAVPLCLQTVSMFVLAYGATYLLHIRHAEAAPAAFIASSNFFELGVATSIALYGLDSPATLVNVVGVLVEVPVMLGLVKVANATKGRFAKFEGDEKPSLSSA